jgi:hypothetical protein
MTDLIFSRTTLVWFFLAGLTTLSWILGHEYSATDQLFNHYLTVGLMFLAFFKVRLVIMHFMEIAHAPIPMRIGFELWCAVIFALVSGIYWLK